MAQYRVVSTSFINNALCNVGDIIEYDGVPSDNLEAIDKPALKAVEASGGTNADSLARQAVAALGGDPSTAAGPQEGSGPSLT